MITLYQFILIVLPTSLFLAGVAGYLIFRAIAVVLRRRSD